MLPLDPETPKAAIRRSAARLKSVDTRPDEKTSLELDAQHRRTLLASLSQDIEERKRYALRFFWLTCVWLAFLGVVFIFQGIGSAFGSAFHLSDNLLIALVGAGTIKIIGILYVVANYLFPRK